MTARLGGLLLPTLNGRGYARSVATVVNLPDDIAALFEERAVQQGVTVPELICELAKLSANRQALEEFIGCVDVPVDQPFDIHQARSDTADDLLKEHDLLSLKFTQGSSRSDGFSLGLD